MNCQRGGYTSLVLRTFHSSVPKHHWSKAVPRGSQARRKPVGALDQTIQTLFPWSPENYPGLLKGMADLLGNRAAVRMRVWWRHALCGSYGGRCNVSCEVLRENKTGFGQGLFLLPTVYYATRDVAPEQGTTAAALFNLSRVVGQTFGIAVVGSLITEREKFHSAFLVESLSNANPALTERFNNLVGTFLGEHGDQSLAQLQAWQSLSATFSQQAFVLAFADAFVIISAVLAVSAVMVLMLPALRETPPQRASLPATAATATDGVLGESRRA
jgi:hypothetical protein